MTTTAAAPQRSTRPLPQLVEVDCHCLCPVFHDTHEGMRCARTEIQSAADVANIVGEFGEPLCIWCVGSIALTRP